MSEEYLSITALEREAQLAETLANRNRLTIKLNEEKTKAERELEELKKENEQLKKENKELKELNNPPKKSSV